MPLPRLLVVILMTLGLQVPGGLAFRVCLCNGLFGGTSSHSHGHAGVDKKSCCDDRTKEQPAERVQCAGKEGCRCVLVCMPEPPTPKAAPGELSLAMPPVWTLARVSSIFEPSVCGCEWAGVGAHDPPWERGNVPLRI